jgi:hypothetical protein
MRTRCYQRGWGERDSQERTPGRLALKLALPARTELPKNHERAAAGSDFRALGYHRAAAGTSARRLAGCCAVFGSPPADAAIRC